MEVKNSIIILGIRGIPARHGGFETFAEKLVQYLASKGWLVTVYCQGTLELSSTITESDWKGIRRIHIPVKGVGAKATVFFDYLSIKHALNQPGLVLTLGYNTALFNLWFRLKGKKNLINMDGIEWKREKWAWYEKAWLYLNERAGCLIGHHLIADHPEIKNHIITRVADNKVTMIPYGARCVDNADIALLGDYALQAGSYALVIARPEPENSILEIISAFSAKSRGKSLIVLGKYERSNPYHCQVLNAASDEVKFVGTVYDHAYLDALRFYSCLYVHGHTVGGTNPSLIEALGSGQPILAHDNKFNHWVSGDGAAYFRDKKECAEQFDRLLPDEDTLRNMSEFSRHRFEESFTWDTILKQYEDLLLNWI